MKSKWEESKIHLDDVYNVNLVGFNTWRSVLTIQFNGKTAKGKRYLVTMKLEIGMIGCIARVLWNGLRKAKEYIASTESELRGSEGAE